MSHRNITLMLQCGRWNGITSTALSVRGRLDVQAARSEECKYNVKITRSVNGRRLVGSASWRRDGATEHINGLVGDFSADDDERQQ